MSEVSIREDLKRTYEDCYEDGDSEWRWLGALDKAHNILALCKELPVNSVIEIGAGEGSILKRLSELSFVTELCALEISPTGVTAINIKNIPCLIECSQFDGYNIPYENKRFDLAVLSHVTEHVEYPRKLFYEAKRYKQFNEMYFIYHTCQSDLSDIESVHPNLHLWDSKTIANLVVNAGLVEWLINKRT